MLKDAGFRLFRLTIARKTVERQKDPVAYVRKAAARKGLIMDMEARNPAQPYRHREPRKGFVEIEQLQNITGAFAGCPPEREDYHERFMAGEAWGGVVKSATI